MPVIFFLWFYPVFEKDGGTAFRNMMQAAVRELVQQVDCVGKTIVQYYTEKSTITTVTCPSFLYRPIK